MNVLARSPEPRQLSLTLVPPSFRDIVVRERVAENLRERGYVEIPWDATWVTNQSIRIRDDLRRMIEGPHRNLFQYAQATEIDDQGFFEKNGERKEVLTARETAEKSVVYDHKFFFHCYDTTRAVLAAQGTPVQSYERLFSASGNFNATARRLTAAIVGRLDALNEDERDPGRRYQDSLLDRFVGDRVVTRSAVYKSHEKGDTVAKLHRDRCGLTFHWISSHPGLVLYDRQGQRVVADDSNPGKLLIFLSDKVWTATRGKLGTGILHGAANPENIAGDEARFIAVTFAHCKLADADLQWAERHKDELAIDPADYPL